MKDKEQLQKLCIFTVAFVICLQECGHSDTWETRVGAGVRELGQCPKLLTATMKKGVPKCKRWATHTSWRNVFLDKDNKGKWQVPTFLSLGTVFTVGWINNHKEHQKSEKLILEEKLLMQTIKEDFEVTIISIPQNIHSKRRLGVLGNQIYD